MRPGTSGAPLLAAAAGSCPWRLRISGMTLRPADARCSTITTVAGRSAGRVPTRRVRASTPPADAPMTTRERPPAPISPTTLRLAGSAHRTSEAPAQRAAVVRRHLDRHDVLPALELRDLHLRRARLGQRER